MRAILLLAFLSVPMTVAVAQKPQPRVSSNSDLEARITALEKRIGGLERRVYALEYHNRKDDTAELDVSQLDGPYQRLNTNSGTFLVSLKNIERYLNGYKATISIGNISSATFKGFELTMSWAAAEPSISNANIDAWTKWYNSRKTKNEKYTQDLVPGAWNQVEIILLPARADELGYLEVSLATNTVSLFIR